MSKPKLQRFHQLAPLIVQKYERYLPTAFDESLTLLEKVNKVIEYVNQVSELSSGVVESWNEVMEWVMEDGLTESVNDKLDEMASDGTLDEIINHNIFEDLNDDIAQTNTRIDNVSLDVDVVRSDVNKLQTSFQQVIVNPLDFGAVGDGETDDTQAFQDAVDFIAQSGHGGILNIPYTPDGYCIMGSVDMPSNIVVNGNNVVIHAKSTEFVTPFVWEEKENVTLENIIIDGYKHLKNSSISGQGYGVYFRGACRNIRVRNSKFINTIEHGISISGFVENQVVRRPINALIEGNLFENNGNPNFPNGPRGTGIMCYYGSSKIKIINNHFRNVVQNNIYLDSGSGTREELEIAFPNLSVKNGDYMGYDNQVIGNTFEVTYDHGKFTDNVSGSAVAIHAQKNCIVADNVIEFPVGQYYAFNISGGQEYSPTQDVLIHNNTIMSSYIPVRVFQTKRVQIKNNLIKQNSGNTNPTIYVWFAGSPLAWDISEKDPCDMIEIIGNVIHNPIGWGIRIRNQNGNANTMRRIFIQGNTFYTNDKTQTTSSAIYTEGPSSNIHISDNRFFGGSYGIYLGGATGSRSYIRRNYVQNAKQGIVVTGIADIEYNHTVDCDDDGILVTNENCSLLLNTGAQRNSGEILSDIRVIDGALTISGQGSNRSWNKNPLRIGEYYIWVNAMSGQLMFKYGKPTSMTDGTPIGSGV